MKNILNYIPYIIVIIAGIVVAAAIHAETCRKPKEEAGTTQVSRVIQMVVPARDYQIDIVEDSLVLFDGPRVVGVIPFYEYGQPGFSAIDSLMMIDND